MHLSDLLLCLNPQHILGPVKKQIRHVTHDSRTAGPMDVFVAIRGANHDGRQYVPDLHVAAVIADAPVTAQQGVTTIYVRNARQALAQAAAALLSHLMKCQ